MPWRLAEPGRDIGRRWPAPRFEWWVTQSPKEGNTTARCSVSGWKTSQSRQRWDKQPRTSGSTTAAFEVEVRLSRWCPTSASRATTVQRFRTAYHPDDTTGKPSNAAPLHTPPHASRLERLKVLTRRNGMGPASTNSEDRDHRNPRWLSSGVSNVGPRMAACIPHVAMSCSKPIPPSVRDSWSTSRDSALNE